MRDLAERKFKAKQVAAVLGLSLPELHTLRNVNNPGWRLPASKGRSKRDQRWNALDVIRLALIKAIPYAPGPGERSRLFIQIKDEDLIAARYTPEPVWLGITQGEIPRRSTDPGELCHGQQPGGVATGLVILHLSAIVKQIVEELQRQETAAEAGAP